ncbi:MAG: peptidylprolyl isomerase [Clostridia bacterium]|nr:peptidylprolyl isomerase [Clostridia bacterium]
MENENKEFQGSVEETELQEKVRQDVSEKIAEAAAEVQDEIDEAVANEATEEINEETDLEADENAEELAELDGADYEEEEVIVKEPKIISMKLSSLVMSFISTAVIGALILLFGMQIPKWVEAMPEGKTVATVDGTQITDLDMNYYIYIAAMEYFQEKSDDLSKSPAEYDWSQEVEGKTAEEIVKENALEMAVEEVLLMNAGDKNQVEFNEDDARKTAQAQNDQMISMYGEELVVLNAKRQALNSLKQYSRKVVQAIHMQAVESDMKANPDKYYPEDKSVLAQYSTDQSATYKQIMIKKDTTLEDEALKAASNAEKRAKAEEVLAKLNSGEDFDAVMADANEDKAQPADGYTIEKYSAFLGDEEKAALTLAADSYSEIIETEDGYHIVKRVAGPMELNAYWKDTAKIKVKARKIKKISLKELLQGIDTATDEFERVYAEMQNAQ